MIAKNIYITNEQNQKLAATLEILDENKQGPFMLLLHGFKGYKEELHFSELAKDLLKIGICSIRFDTRGFGESEGTLQNDYRFSNYIKDVECIYRWLRKQEYIDINNLSVMGQSMGGMQAIVFASKHPELKACISVSPPNQMAVVDELGKELDKWKKNGYIILPSSKYGQITVPYAFIEDARKFVMTDFVNKIKVPQLFILGLHDKTVLPEQTKIVYDAAPQPKQLIEVRHMDHFYKNYPTLLKEVNTSIIEFLQKHLYSSGTGR